MSNRITLNMSVIEAVCALVDGHPGAMDVCVRMVKEAPTICPSWGKMGFLPLIQLDSEGLYGPSIWVLYKDLCESKIDRTWALLCASQMGLVCNGQTLKWMTGDGGTRVTNDLREYLKVVIDAVPAALADFTLATAVTEQVSP